jgi:cell division protein FtsB
VSDKIITSVDIALDDAARIAELEQRLAAAEAKNTELEKELFVLSSDVIYCGCGHVSAGLQEKAKRIYGKLRESGGEG